jgi:hypothetical protein
MIDRAASRMSITKKNKGKGEAKTQTWEIAERDKDDDE